MTEEEFKEFFNKNFESLRNYLYYRSGDKELASDIMQDTFIKLWEKQINDEGKKTVGLAYKIANDLFLNKHQRSALEANYLSSLEFEFNNTTPEKEMQYKELKEFLQFQCHGALLFLCLPQNPFWSYLFRS